MSRSVRIQVAFRTSCSLDTRKEPRPHLVVLTSRSALAEPARVVLQRRPDDDISGTQHVAVVHVKAGTSLLSLAFFADLFADTAVSLGPMTRSIGEERAQTQAQEGEINIPCRRFVARAIWTWMDIVHGRTMEAMDMAKTTKLSLHFQADQCRVDDQPLVDFTYRLPDAARLQEEFLHRSEKCVEHMKDLALRANRRFGSFPSIVDRFWTFNTSYVEALYSPVGTPLRPIPGWVDLRHLRTIGDTTPPTPPSFFQEQMEWACRRMGISPEHVQRDWQRRTKHKTLLALETVCDALAHMARRCIYLHDTVERPKAQTGRDACDTKPADVDDYKFPRLADEYARAGDDCESLSKETLLMAVELERLKIDKDTHPLAWLARQVVKAYTWYQITGAITDDRGELGCHSWVMALPNDLNDCFIRQHDAQRRDSERRNSASSSARLPVLVVESTDSTTSTTFEYPRDEEERRARFKKWLHTAPIADALRFKTPASLMRKNCRYAYLSSAVTWQNWSQYGALEFMFCHHDPETGQRVHGVPFEAVMKRRRHAEVEMCATIPLSRQDLDMADQVLEWYPPIRTLAHQPTQHRATAPSAESALLVFLRSIDWDHPLVRQAWQEWCQERDVHYDVLPTVKECVDVDTVYLAIEQPRR